MLKGVRICAAWPKMGDVYYHFPFFSQGPVGNGMNAMFMIREESRAP